MILIKFNKILNISNQVVQTRTLSANYTLNPNYGYATFGTENETHLASLAYYLSKTISAYKVWKYF